MFVKRKRNDKNDEQIEASHAVPEWYYTGVILHKMLLKELVWQTYRNISKVSCNKW